MWYTHFEKGTCTFNQIPLQPRTGRIVSSTWPVGSAWNTSLRECTKRKHFQRRRADHTSPTSPHLSSHHNPSPSLTQRKLVSLHPIVPEVTLAHCSRHTDSLTAVEIYCALAKIKYLPSCGILMTSQSFTACCGSNSPQRDTPDSPEFDWQVGYPTLWPFSPPLEEFWL